MKIPKPPKVGMGFLLIRLLLGLSIAPTLIASLRIKGTKSADIIIVAKSDAKTSYIISSPLSFIRFLTVFMYNLLTF